MSLRGLPLTYDQLPRVGDPSTSQASSEMCLLRSLLKSPEDMSGVADPGNFYVSNAKLWASGSCAPAYSPRTTARIPWKPLEGAKISESSYRKYLSEQLPI